MDWVKLYTDLLTHRKWIGLSPRAKAMLTQAWMFAGQNETDGHVPDTARKLIDHSPQAARELEQAGWLHRNGSGWHIHDWAEWQVTKERMEEIRQQGRDRQERLRTRRKEAA